MKVVCNSSPLIALGKIKKLWLLDKYEIVVPQAVFREVTKSKKEYSKELYRRCKNRVIEIKNKKAAGYLELMLDRGEAEVIDAKEIGSIKEVKPVLDELIKNKIRISRELYEHALRSAALASKRASQGVNH